jgi:4'-phosphopantetheinyl transferase EntD
MPAARRGRGARVVSLRLHQATWPHAALPARLAEHDAVVCTASLLAGGDDVRAMATVLAPSERSRLETYTNDVVARRYLRGRMLLRVMLGAARGVAPAEVPLREGPHGKPYLVAGKARPIWFSVSHCDELFVLAVSRKADVGVDVERERAIEQWQRVADRVLDPRERRQLDRGSRMATIRARHFCATGAAWKRSSRRSAAASMAWRRIGPDYALAGCGSVISAGCRCRRTWAPRGDAIRLRWRSAYRGPTPCAIGTSPAPTRRFP